MNFLLQIILDYMYVPGKVENSIVFIDINKLPIFSMPTKLIM